MNRPQLLLWMLLSMMIPVFTGSRLSAQDINEDHFVRYTTQQGLSHNMITGIAQDSTGYMWIATFSGLNRFNGSNFVQFHCSNDSASLPSEKLTGLTPLDHYRLAIYANGLHIIDTHTGETHNLFIPYKDKQYQYKFNFIVSVTSNEAGHIFIITRSGFYHYDNRYNLLFRFDYHPAADVATYPFAFGRDLLWLDQQRLAIVSLAGIYIYHIAGRQLKKMSSADCPLLASFLDYPGTGKPYKFIQQQTGRILVIKPGSDSLVYINLTEQKKTISRLPYHCSKDEFGYRSSLITVSDTLLYLTGHITGFYKLRLHPESGTIDFYPRKYFSSYYCNSILTDKEANLWIATNKGVFRQDLTRTHIQQAAIPAAIEGPFPTIVVDDVCTNGDKLFAATRGNGGLLVFDKKTLRFNRRISFQQYSRIADNIDNIFSLAPVDDTSLLIGTNGPLFRLNSTNFQVTPIIPDQWNKNDWIADLCKDRNGNVWIASANLYRYNAAKQVISLVTGNRQLLDKIHMPMLLHEDGPGNIWIAGHGLCRYNRATNNYDRLIDSFPFIKMPDKQVNAFTVDHQNNCWISCYNNGLIRYDINSGALLHFTRDDGLPDNNIASLVVIGNKLWIAGYSGIACLDLTTFAITSFGPADGFPDLPIVQGAAFFYDAAWHRLYLGFSNTIVRFNPDSMLKKSPAPRLFIESLTTGDQKNIFLPGKSITASWRNNEITVTIGSINFFNSSSQRFAYRIIKDNSGYWQQLGSQNVFSISNLAPGHHRIQVKLFSSDNHWPEQIKEIRITISPPFWRSTWFLFVSLVIGLLSVYALVQWQATVARKKEQAKTHIQKLIAEAYKKQFELEQKHQEIITINQQLAEAQLSALQTQMNPHFIFNSLNSINWMILENQQQKASRYLSKFAQMIRLTLNQSKVIFATLVENIEYLERYLEMEKLRFGNSFTYRIIVDAQIDEDDTQIPTLMIQPLVENAIWHGLMHKEGEKTLTIRFSRQQDTITCVIEDNGIGIKQSERLKQGKRPGHRSVGLGNLHNRIMIMNEKFGMGCRLDLIDLSDIDEAKSGTLAVLRFNIVNSKS